MIFYRFGDIPEDECSSIWNNNDEVIGKEKGVSVYEAHKNINGQYTPVIPFPTNAKAFNDFIYPIGYFTGNKYLVTSDLLDETGTNGEPLIKNVKIIKKLQFMNIENIKFKANIQCMQNREIHIALHNSGYRYLNKTNDVYTYGKPIGYGILRADFYPGDMEIEILLIVKGNIKDGKRPNLIWTSCRQEISSEHNDQYLKCVQTIRDCEAEIFDNSPVAILENRSVRYDFEENSTLDIE